MLKALQFCGHQSDWAAHPADPGFGFADQGPAWLTNDSPAFAEASHARLRPTEVAAAAVCLFGMNMERSPRSISRLKSVKASASARQLKRGLPSRKCLQLNRDPPASASNQGA